MLAQSGEYDPQLLQWHKWTGFAVAAGCTGTLLLSWLGRPLAYRLSLLVTLALLIVTTHFGASITHGRDYLTEYAPAPLRALFQGKAGVRGIPDRARPVAATHVRRGSSADPVATVRCLSRPGETKGRTAHG